MTTPESPPAGTEPRIEVGETVSDGEPVWFDRYDGAGIGPAMVQHTVRRHGERRRIEDAVEKGVTFYFTFEVETKEI